MTEIDFIIILTLVWGAYRGWKNGLLKEVVSMLGFFVGLFIAYELYGVFGEWLAPQLSGNVSVGRVFGRVLAFIILWVVVPIVLGLVATVLTKTLKGLRLGFPNSMLGLLVGALKFYILLSFVFGAMDALHILSQEKKDASLLYNTVALAGDQVFHHDDRARPADDAQQGDSVQSDTTWIEIHHDKK